MIDEVGGGMRERQEVEGVHPRRIVVPGADSRGVEGATMDYDSMAARKSMLGSGGVIIMDEDTCMVKAALRIMRFYAHESCGWCIPCREGTTWLKKILERFHQGGGTRGDIDLIGDISTQYAGPYFLPAGRCGGHADAFDCGEVPQRIRRPSGRQAVPLRARDGDGVTLVSTTAPSRSRLCNFETPMRVTGASRFAKLVRL